MQIETLLQKMWPQGIPPGDYGRAVTLVREIGGTPVPVPVKPAGTPVAFVPAPQKRKPGRPPGAKTKGKPGRPPKAKARGAALAPTGRLEEVRAMLLERPRAAEEIGPGSAVLLKLLGAEQVGVNVAGAPIWGFSDSTGVQEEASAR